MSLISVMKDKTGWDKERNVLDKRDEGQNEG